MFDDRIEVTSPGGLPPTITKDEYLLGGVSAPRNPLLANVFFRLGYVESFGTGIRKINNAYAGFVPQPMYDITAEAVRITLSVISSRPDIDSEEARVLDALADGNAHSRQEIEKHCGFARDRVLRILHTLEQKGTVRRTGQARATRYVRRI